VAKLKQTVFERGEHIYIVSPISPFTPDDSAIEEFAFADQLRKQAPNENLKWLQGQYVESDNPNKNGQVWTAGEIAIKSLTPMFMPVTVMHDTRSAVGVIADTRLLTPEKDQVPRARIDNTLAVWGHRFPEVAAEIDLNYEQGSLMQSMECISPYYSCAECGQTFQKLPGGAERANWCNHLSEAAGVGNRILQGVVFTGTGLIFGTRGKEGANPSAHLEVFQEEVAEFHEKAHRELGRTRKSSRRRRKTSMESVEISPEEYASLSKRPTVEEFAAEKKRADEAVEKLGKTEKDLEAAEAAQKKAEDERDEKDKKLKEAEEAQSQVTLRDERMGKLGAGFVYKLGETTKKNVTADAGTMDEEAWEKRLSEVEELAGVKRDAKLDKGKGKEGDEPPASNGNGAPEKDDEFSEEELASTVTAGGGDGGTEDGEPSENQRASVVRGLLPSRSKPEPVETK
jgi:hypothetical protein